MVSKLTPKQEAFCQEYIIDLNGTQAAIRAGYSARTAIYQASRLLTNVNIQAKIQELQKEQSERRKRTADDVLRDIYEVGQEARRMGEFNPALKALELEGKHLGAFDGNKGEKEVNVLDKLCQLMNTYGGNI